MLQAEDETTRQCS